MESADIQRLREQGDANKYNIKLHAADQHLTSIRDALKSAEDKVDELLEGGYSNEANTRLMVYLNVLRRIEEVSKDLNKI
jgi:hypothetical protein